MKREKCPILTLLKPYLNFGDLVKLSASSESLRHFLAQNDPVDLDFDLWSLSDELRVDYRTSPQSFHNLRSIRHVRLFEVNPPVLSLHDVRFLLERNSETLISIVVIGHVSEENTMYMNRQTHALFSERELGKLPKLNVSRIAQGYTNYDCSLKSEDDTYRLSSPCKIARFFSKSAPEHEHKLLLPRVKLFRVALFNSVENQSLLSGLNIPNVDRLGLHKHSWTEVDSLTPAFSSPRLNPLRNVWSASILREIILLSVADAPLLFCSNQFALARYKSVSVVFARSVLEVMCLLCQRDLQRRLYGSSIAYTIHMLLMPCELTIQENVIIKDLKNRHSDVLGHSLLVSRTRRKSEDVCLRKDIAVEYLFSYLYSPVFLGLDSHYLREMCGSWLSKKSQGSINNVLLSDQEFSADQNSLLISKTADPRRLIGPNPFVCGICKKSTALCHFLQERFAKFVAE